VTENSPVLQEVAVGDFRGYGETLAEAHVRERFGLTVVAVVTLSGDVVVNPPATTSIRAGSVFLVCPNGLRSLPPMWEGGTRANQQPYTTSSLN